MGEGTPRLELFVDDHHDRAVTPEELNGQIAVVREDLDLLLAELDRRRHELMDVKYQLRRHAVGVGVTAAAFLGSAAGFVLWRQRRQRRREQLVDQAGRLRHAVARMIERPERVAAEPTIAGKIIVAAANAALASLIKKGLERALDRALDASGSPPSPSATPGRRSIAA
jgi:hypothetical protein